MVHYPIRKGIMSALTASQTHKRWASAEKFYCLCHHRPSMGISLASTCRAMYSAVQSHTLTGNTLVFNHVSNLRCFLDHLDMGPLIQQGYEGKRFGRVVLELGNNRAAGICSVVWRSEQAFHDHSYPRRRRRNYHPGQAVSRNDAATNMQDWATQVRRLLDNYPINALALVINPGAAAAFSQRIKGNPFINYLRTKRESVHRLEVRGRLTKLSSRRLAEELTASMQKKPPVIPRRPLLVTEPQPVPPKGGVGQFYGESRQATHNLACSSESVVEGRYSRI